VLILFTGTCAVLVTDNGNDRSLCANLAAANCFTIDHIRKPENKLYIGNAKFFYVSVSWNLYMFFGWGI
jgi:adenosine kinase